MPNVQGQKAAHIYHNSRQRYSSFSRKHINQKMTQKSQQLNIISQVQYSAPIAASILFRRLDFFFFFPRIILGLETD